jgi:hypothetical protein
VPLETIRSQSSVWYPNNDRNRVVGCLECPERSGRTNIIRGAPGGSRESALVADGFYPLCGRSIYGSTAQR